MSTLFLHFAYSLIVWGPWEYRIRRYRFRRGYGVDCIKPPNPWSWPQHYK